MMVQTGMATSHGRGTQHHLFPHPSLNGNHLLHCKMGSQQPHLLQIRSPTKPSQAASPSAQVPSQASVSLPLVQTAHETQKKATFQEAKTTFSPHMAIQNINAYLASLLEPPQGWLSRGALRLQLFVFGESPTVLQCHQFMHPVIVKSIQAPRDANCRL